MKQYGRGNGHGQHFESTLIPSQQPFVQKINCKSNGFFDQPSVPCICPSSCDGQTKQKGWNYRRYNETYEPA